MKSTGILTLFVFLTCGWLAPVNAAPTITWHVNEQIAPLSASPKAYAIVLADEPGVADVVWRKYPSGEQSYTQFVNGSKFIDSEHITFGTTYAQLGIRRRYDGKLRVGIRTGNAGASPNFREYTRHGIDDWSASSPASPARINTAYTHCGGYDVDPCTGLGGFMVFDANDTIRYYRETAQDVWTTGVDVHLADPFFYSGFCDFLITPDGAPIGAYKINKVATGTVGLHAGQLDPCGGPITSVIPDSGSAAWTGQSMTVAADGAIYVVDMRSTISPKVQVSKSEDNGATWIALGVPSSAYHFYAQGGDIQIAVAPDKSQMALLSYSPTAGDYTNTLYISEPNDDTSVEIGVEWHTDPGWLPGAGDLDFSDIAYDPAGNLYVVYCRDTGAVDETGLRLLSNAPLLIDADLDDDGDVDLVDLIILAANWLASTGDPPCSSILPGYLDNDCDVDSDDYALLVANWTGPLSIEPGTFTLLAAGANPAPIVVNSTDTTIQAAANQLAQKLQAISAAEFTIGPGNGKSGIVVGLAGDFEHLPPNAAVFGAGPDPSLTDEAFLREQYRIYSTDDAVCLIGKTPLAVQHAVWDLLYRFGYRQYFPRSTWEHIPSHDTLTIEIDTDEVPDYRARQIVYNGALTRYYPEWNNDTPFQEWAARNRMAKGFNLVSGHNYNSIVLRNQSTFDAHPEYYALVDGVRDVKDFPKFCIDNQDLRDLIGPDAVAEMDANPDLDSISREPSDGGWWCECDGVYDPLHNPDSTNCTGNFTRISDQALTLANIAAQALVDAGYTDKYVGMLAYNKHGDPPVDSNVLPNVFVSVARGFTTGNYTFDELLQGWDAKGATLGIYDYFSVYQWDLGKPRISVAAYPYDLASDTRDFYNSNARFHAAESGDTWGPHGLGFYISNRVMWDVDEADNVEATIDEFLANMFGPAATDMAKFYDLINVDQELRSDENLAASMYKYLDDAVTAADPCAAILDRLYDLVGYTHFLELRADYDADKSQANEDALLAWVYRIRLTDMVHALRMWHVFGYFDEAVYDPDYYLKDANDITETESLALLAAGRSRFGDPPVPYPSFLDEFVVYSEDLVPAAEPLNLSHPVQTGWHPVNSSTDHYYWVWLDPCDPCRTTITFDASTHSYGGTIPFPDISLYHAEHGLDPVDTKTWPAADPNWHRVTFDTPYQGLHRVRVEDGGHNQSTIDWDPDPGTVSDTALATLPQIYDVADWHRLFRFWAGSWGLFFYVPPGTQTVGFWANSPVGNLRDNDNNIVAEWVAGDPTEWYEVDVPAGQDGKVWYMISFRGTRVLTTVPSYYAKTVDNLLLPREVVYGVSPGQATIPSPPHAAPGVPLNTDLGWNVGQATATQKLYLDTLNPPTQLESDLSGSDSSYNPAPLLPATTYYWRLDAGNVNGPTAGTVWSFTTAGP